MATSNTRRNADARGDDLYTTPPWAIRALLSREKFSGNIVDAGCGTGNITNVLVDQGYDRKDITTIDKYDQGYKDLDVLLDYADFDPYENVDNVISNPPFLLFTPFVLKSLKLATKKVAIFARINSLETEKRYKAIHRDNPPSKIYSFVNRVKCAKGGEDGKNDGSVMYCWLVWDFSYGSGATTFEWISGEKGDMSSSKPKSNVKHIVCYSGGHSSARVAIAVAKKYGPENTVLLNHNINKTVESADIKRFKLQVANYIGVPITFANVNDIMNEDDIPDQFDVVKKASAFKVGAGTELCTSRLKTEPFMKWLTNNVDKENCVVYYGFDKNESNRIQRRSQILGVQGYKSDYPLALWDEDTYIKTTNEIGIEPPMQYEKFKHANCIGCLKAGRQHWYIVYCTRPEIYKKAMETEDDIGYTIIKGVSLEEMIPVFEEMKALNIPQTEHMAHQTFWKIVRKAGIDTSTDEDRKPCECIF